MPGSWAASGRTPRGATRAGRRSSPACRRRASSRITDLTIPGPAGPLPARRYDPPGAGLGDGPLPALVFFHGGGFVFGDLDTHDELCRMLCFHAQVCVIAIDYRLAPENPLPAAVDDALAAFGWVHAERRHARDRPGPDRRRRRQRRRQPLRGRRPADAPGRRSRAPRSSCSSTRAPTRGPRRARYELFKQGLLPRRGGHRSGSPSPTRADLEDLRAAPLPRHGPVRPARRRTSRPRASTRCATRARPTRPRLADAGVPTAVRRHEGLIHGFASMTAVSPHLAGRRHRDRGGPAGRPRRDAGAGRGRSGELSRLRPDDGDGNGLRGGFAAAHVEPEGRVDVGHQRGVGDHAAGPSGSCP